MAQKKVEILLSARDEATKALNNVAQGTLPGLVKSLGGMAAGALSAGAAISFVADSFREFAESEKITRKLEGALRDAGLEVQSNSSHLDAMATRLARVSMADDEAIKGAQTLLVSLGGLAGDGLDRSTEAALDLSAALGKDLNEAAEMIAKAANGSTTAFGKLGFKFREGASDAENFNAVLGQIQEKFGTAAESEIDTMAGAVNELAEAWSELKSAIGGTAGNSGVTQALKLATAALDNFNRQAQQDGFWKGLGTTLAAIGPAGLGSGGLTLGTQTAAIDAEAERRRLEEAGLTADQDARLRAEEERLARERAKAKADKEAADAAAAKAAEDFARVVARLQEGLKYAAPLDFVNRRRELPLTGLSPDVFSAGFDQPAPFPRTAGQALGAAGAPDFAQIAIEGLDAASAWEAANAQFGDSKEKMAAVAEALAPALERMQQLGMATPEATEALREMGDVLTDQEERLTRFSDAADIMAVFQSSVVESAGAIAAGTESIGEAFRKMVKDVLNALSNKMLANAIDQTFEAFKALASYNYPAAALHFKAAALATAGAAGVKALATQFASGGIVGRHGALQRFAGGGMVRPAPGFDSVPAMLTPGELVLTKRATDSVLGGRAVLASPDAARGNGGAPTVYNVTIRTLDVADFEAYLAKNPQALRAGLESMNRRGY